MSADSFSVGVLRSQVYISLTAKIIHGLLLFTTQTSQTFSPEKISIVLLNMMKLSPVTILLVLPVLYLFSDLIQHIAPIFSPCMVQFLWLQLCYSISIS